MAEQFTMIINHRNTGEDRYKNLYAVTEYFFNLFRNSIEIIVVEQDDLPKIKGNNYFRHVYAFNDGLINRSWGFNVGLTVATHNKIIFNDNDIFISKQAILDTLHRLNDVDTINPYTKVIDMSRMGTDEFIKNYNISDGERRERQGINFSGGMLAFNKDALIKIGGWDEGMRGWGGEDDLMTHKITNMCTYGQLDNVAYHLYHERFQNDTSMHSHYQSNVEQLNSIRGLNREQLFEYYSTKIIGDSTKYLLNR